MNEEFDQFNAMDLQDELMRHSALEGARDSQSLEQFSGKPRKTNPNTDQDGRPSAAPSDNFASKYLEFMGGDDQSKLESQVSK